MGWRLDLVILEGFSNLNDSMIPLYLNGRGQVGAVLRRQRQTLG